MRKIFTVGHSQHNIDYFISMLHTYEINYLIDVRSMPFSKYATEYNKEIVKVSLAESNIKYVFMGENFGARPKNKDLYSAKGYLDFSKMKKSNKFLEGIDSLIKGIDQGNRIALMCTEKEPIECHRAILVANAFFEKGIEVEHILADNTVQTHRELNKQLLDIHFPDRYQISLFENENLTEKEFLNKAYEIQNEKIGYQTEEQLGMNVS